MCFVFSSTTSSVEKKNEKNTHYKYDTLFNCKKMNI